MGTELLIETFCRLQEKLHLVAGRMLRDEMEVEDAVQDTFCRLWSAQLPDTADEARFRMFAVLRNVCINKLRRERPLTGLESLDVGEESPPDMDTVRIRDALLNALTPAQRQIFCLSAFEDMEYEEIAENLGLSIEAVRTHMCRARKILREKYKKLNR